MKPKIWGLAYYGNGHIYNVAATNAEAQEMARLAGPQSKVVPLYDRSGFPPGWEASRNENGSITVTNDEYSIIVEADAASARQAPEEMFHALLVALGA